MNVTRRRSISIHAYVFELDSIIEGKTEDKESKWSFDAGSFGFSGFSGFSLHCLQSVSSRGTMASPEADKLGAADASLPSGVQGAMDGEKPPMSQMEEFKQALEPMKQRYGHYLTLLRPWREFLRLGKPEGDIQKRLQTNLMHFQVNYGAIFLVQVIVAIIMNPSCLVVISVCAVVWMAFLKKNDDPNWEVSVGGMQLGKTQRWMALSAITAIVLLCVVGQVFFSAAFFCAILVLVHGILHPVPQEGTFEQISEII